MKNMKMTMLATALLAATSLAFAADKPSSPPGQSDKPPVTANGHKGEGMPPPLEPETVPPTDPVEPVDPPDEDGDGLPDDDDGDDDGDGEIDEWEDQPANSFGQQTSDAAQADDREGGMNNSASAQERNRLRGQDTDGDGSNDYLDTDDDGDGISDEEELDADDDDGPVDDEANG